MKRPLPTVVSIACAAAFAGCGFRTPLDLPLEPDFALAGAAGTSGAAGAVGAAGSTGAAGEPGNAPMEIVGPAPGCGTLDLAVGGGSVYWADAGHGRVARKVPGMGRVWTIAEGETQPRTVVVRGDKIFWIGDAGKAVRFRNGGGITTTLYFGDRPINGLTASDDGTIAYFSTWNGVMMVPASGGTALDIAYQANGGLPMALAMSGNQIAFPTSKGDVDVVVASTGALATCGEALEDRASFFNCWRVAERRGALLTSSIAIARSVVAFASNWQLGFARMVGSPQQTVTVSFPVLAPITSLALAGGSVVFTVESTPDHGAVYQVALEPNATPSRVAGGLNAPVSVVTDAQTAYWSTGDCAIQGAQLPLR